MIFARRLSWNAALVIAFLAGISLIPATQSLAQQPGTVDRSNMREFVSQAVNAAAQQPLFAGTLCKLDGPQIVKPGEQNLYVFRVQDDTGDDLLGDFGFNHTFSVSIDHTSGNGKITGVFLEKGESKKQKDTSRGLPLSGHREVSTNYVDDVDVESAVFVEEDLVDWLADKYDYKIEGNPCGASAFSIVWACISAARPVGHPEHGNGKQCDVFKATSDGDDINAWTKAVDEALKEGPPFAQCLPPESDSLPEIGSRALRRAGYTNADGIKELRDWTITYCETFFAPFPSIIDAVGLFEVTCIEPGDYWITIADHAQTSSLTRQIRCEGVPSDLSGLAYVPTAVEIVPALGNVSHSFFLVTLLDKDGRMPMPGFEVDFITDRCSIETSGVDTVDEIVMASQIFGAFSPNVPESAAAIENSDAAKAQVDSDRKVDTTKSLTVGDTSRAAAILGCNPDDAPGESPGVANVTVRIESDDEDIVLLAQVVVVGPPAVIEAQAAPASVRCGEKIEIKATVGDAIRQGVSNHTLLEATTNAGGVLGGTGAVAGQAGPVVPISSTVAETFNAVATFYLLTSELHTGPYQVAIRAGGAGVVQSGPFVSPPVVAVLEVSCFLPVPAAGGQQTAAGQQPPPLTAPRTGSGSSITPPNTGDGGLVE